MKRLLVNSTNRTEMIPVILVDGIRNGTDAEIVQCPIVASDFEPSATTHLATGNIIKDARLKNEIPTSSLGNCFRNAIVDLLVARYGLGSLKKPVITEAIQLSSQHAFGTSTSEPVRL